jgi:DNA replication and repair protein RecF
VWVRRLEIDLVRNVREAKLELGEGLNVFHGHNAQGKTTLLEAVGLAARARSFRAEDPRSLIQRGAAGLRSRAAVATATRPDVSLEIELTERQRRLRVDGRETTARDYQGRLEVVVYSTDRLRVIHGPMRERRQFLDRGAASLWPTYRELGRDYDRVVHQRNAALQARSRDLPVWNERLAELGSALRQRRAAFAARLRLGLAKGFRPRGEAYGIRLQPEVETQSPEEGRAAVLADMERAKAAELNAGRSLVGPHRDRISLTVDGEDAAERASAGQGRSLLLALALATLGVYREERGEPAVALLDDLDSELDEERVHALCREVAASGQALVTTAHPGWVRRLQPFGQMFHVEGGEVRAA